MSDAKVESVLVPAEEIEKRKKRLDALVKGDFKPRLRNYRYVVNFELPWYVEPRSDYQPAVTFVRSFTVKKDTIFDVRSMEQAHTVVGTLATTGQSAQITLSPVRAASLVTWVWKRYDSGSGREMQSDWLPSTLLMSENRNGFWFGDPDRSGGRDFLSGGSEVVVTLGLIRANNLLGVTGLSSVTGHNIQINFSGVEVML